MDARGANRRTWLLVVATIAIVLVVAIVVNVWRQPGKPATGAAAAAPFSFPPAIDVSQPEATPVTPGTSPSTPASPATQVTTSPAQIVRPSTAPAPPAPAPANNALLANGDFSSGTSPWWSMPGLPIDNQGGRLRATVNGGTSQPWDAMVAHDFSPLTGGKSYVLSFDASASVNRDIPVTVQMGASPYTNTMWKLCSLGTTAKHYSYSFTSNVNTDWGLVTFQLGNNGAFTFWLDNVVLTRTS